VVNRIFYLIGFGIGFTIRIILIIGFVGVVIRKVMATVPDDSPMALLIWAVLVVGTAGLALPLVMIHYSQENS